jgi:deferrochelatase/peroxidase EfeB
MSGEAHVTLSRRGLLRAAVGGGAAIAAEQVTGAPSAAALNSRNTSKRSSAHIVPFYGVHQAGITTAPADYLVLAAFDIASTARGSMAVVLRAWTEAAARMSRGERASAFRGGLASPPSDTGEAIGAGPQRLTVTIGFGPELFGKLAMTHRRPVGLRPLPPMPGDQLDAAYSDGDLVVQACAGSQLVALHAVRQLARLGTPVVTMRWLQSGFAPAARPPAVASTPRNLLGFKDGTANPDPGSPRLADSLWIQAPDQPHWAHAGTYLAVRRIRMDLGRWDGDSLNDQQRSVGRVRDSGAPLSGGSEFTPPRFRARRNGALDIPETAHIRVARPQNGEGPMLRRGCSFDDGATPDGQLNAGQIFLAFVRDLQTQFVPALSRVTAGDRMTKRYTTHVGSAVFVIPPGARKGGYVGQTLFD